MTPPRAQVLHEKPDSQLGKTMGCGAGTIGFLLSSGVETGTRKVTRGHVSNYTFPDPLPGLSLAPSLLLQPEKGRFLHFHSVTFWVGNAKQVEARARCWSGQRAGKKVSSKRQASSRVRDWPLGGEGQGRCWDCPRKDRYTAPYLHNQGWTPTGILSEVSRGQRVAFLPRRDLH